MLIENESFRGKLEFKFFYVRIRGLETEQIWEHQGNEVGHTISKWTLGMLGTGRSFHYCSPYLSCSHIRSETFKSMTQ